MLVPFRIVYLSFISVYLLFLVRCHNYEHFLLQILKIMKHGSVRGLSVASFELEVIGYTIALAYCVHKGLPFSAYGELAFLLIQGLPWVESELSFPYAKFAIFLLPDLLNQCLSLVCSNYLGCNHLLLLPANGNENLDESFTVSLMCLFERLYFRLVVGPFPGLAPMGTKTWMTMHQFSWQSLEKKFV
jgi:hypothetical protein